MYNTLLTCSNFFERTAEFGTYSISENAIAVRGDYKAGQYVRIMDSLLNDGVYKIASVEAGEITLNATLTDEEFSGHIVGLAIPKQFIEIAEKINKFETRGISSESIPNYSVTYSAKNGVEAYKTELAPFMKPYQSPYYFLNWVAIYD
ncbi:MAG TPA: hypothetical protein VFD52_00215 [Clostridia bacterium]|nr:hypothetical protein [Clostridia bacterium]